MKIAFPLLNEKELALDFSKSKYVGIYDDTISRLDIVSICDDNIERDLSILFKTLLQHDLKFVISPFCSFMSLRILKENNLEACQAVGSSIQENIHLLKNNKLEPFMSTDVNGSTNCAIEYSSCL